MEAKISTAVHADVTRMSIQDVVRALNENLGPTIVQTIAGTKDRGAPSRWARGNGTPRPEAQQRLRHGYQVWWTIAKIDGSSVALAWLMGSNPRLDYEIPLQLVIDGRIREALGAAESFVEGTPAA